MTDTQRCQTCKHWKPNGTNHWGDCQSPKLINANKQAVPPEKDILCAFAGFMSTIETGKHFGCIHHAKNE